MTIIDSRYVSLGNMPPQINVLKGIKPAFEITYPTSNQKQIVLSNSRAGTTLKVVAVEWVTKHVSSKIKVQVNYTSI